MIKYLEKTGEINFDKIFNQRLGYLLFKDFSLNVVLEQVEGIMNVICELKNKYNSYLF